MGITGLIPFLEKASTKTNLRALQNSTVAIDSYCWLHKGAFAVADKLARGEETDIHIQYCLKYVNMLLDNNIKPILVFDGRHLPAKAETEAKRREQRKNAKQRAAELMRLGKMEEARSFLRRCVDITHEMALKLIQACREMNVDCIVAPYEADGQLAFLNLQKIADYVITEDSDLVLFGCSRILFKLDLTGSCLLIEADKLYLSMGCKPEKFSFDKFRNMCILSGCDYIDSLPGIGLAKACKFIMKTEETDMLRALDKIPAYLNMRQLTVTEEYKINFMKANATFQHMIVFDPRKRKNVHLTDPEEVGTDLEYCSNAGVKLDDKTAMNLALGNLNPFTMKALDNWHPDRREKPKGAKTSGWKRSKIAKHPSIWEANLELFNEKKKIIPHQPTLLNMIKRSHEPSDSEKRKQPKKFTMEIEDSDDEPNDDGQSSEDLLSAYTTSYTSTKQPPSKKFRESFETTSPPVFEPQSPKRNPFKVKANSSLLLDILSPTKLTKANSSLIRNQSPVKRIEYPTPSPVKCLDYSKLQKLSKFKRTVISKEENVISRFFSGEPVKVEDVARTENGVKAEEDSDLGNAMEIENKTENSEENGTDAVALDKESSSKLFLELSSKINSNNENRFERETTPERDIFTSSGSTSTTDQDSSRPATQGSNDEENSSAESQDLSVQEILIEQTMIIIDDDDDDKSSPVVVGSKKTTIDLKQFKAPTISNNKNNTKSCRKPGLAKAKSSSKVSSSQGPVQSRLSMFGFQKKPQVT